MTKLEADVFHYSWDFTWWNILSKPIALTKRCKEIQELADWLVDIFRRYGSSKFYGFFKNILGISRNMFKPKNKKNTK